MFHSPKRHHGICCPLHLYQWSASALTVGTCGIITTTNRDLAERAACGRSWGWKIVGWVDLTPACHQCLISSLSLPVHVFLPLFNASSYSPKSPQEAFGSTGDPVEIMAINLPFVISGHRATQALPSPCSSLGNTLLTDGRCLQQHLRSNTQWQQNSLACSSRCKAPRRDVPGVSAATTLNKPLWPQGTLHSDPSLDGGCPLDCGADWFSGATPSVM